MVEFLSGAVTLGFLVGAAFFIAFYRKTGDRLFIAFAAAFLLFALNQGLSFALTVVSEPTSLIYALRVLGFVLIIWAIVDKNIQKPLARSQRRVR
jgi:hypothetical protein